MRLILALGGNALLDPEDEQSYSVQQQQVRRTAERIAGICEDHEVVIVHGNGPQVGALMAQQHGAEFSRPLDALVAETQGQIGYLLQRELRRQDVGVATVVTQTVVDPDDPAFDAPTKPVGPFVDAETAAATDGTYRELGTGDRRFRRVVPSPEPRAIVERSEIEEALGADGAVIAAGGGGIPVTSEQEGVEAVIDKDAAAARLGIGLDADRLMILTDVSHAFRDHPADTDPITRTTPDRVEQMLEDGLFGDGSMRPKITAAAGFVDATGGEAVIGSLDRPEQVIAGEGTLIRPETE